MTFISIGQIKIGSSERIEKEEYAIQYSRIIEDGYWNYAFLKKSDIDFAKVWADIKVDMENLKRKPLLYLMSNTDNHKIKEGLKSCHLENIYTDVWMTVEHPENFGNYESNIEVQISQVKSEEREAFIQAIMDGFSSDNPADPYGTLPEEYRKIYDLKFVDEEFKKLEYLGKHKGEIVATANLWYKGDCAIIYSVSTKKKFQRQGICKKMMSQMMKDLSKLGIQTVCVQTERGFYTEEVYQKMGFHEGMLRRSVWRNRIVKGV